MLKGVSRYPESIGREEAPSAVNPPRLPRRQCASKWVASAAAIEAGSVCKWPPLPIGTETVVYGHALTRDLPMGGGGRQLEQDQRRRRSVRDVAGRRGSGVAARQRGWRSRASWRPAVVDRGGWTWRGRHTRHRE